MRAGALVESVAFDEPTGTTGSLGSETVEWTEHYVCRAQWIYGRGDESVQAARNAGRKAYKIRVRSCEKARAIDETYRMRDVRRSDAWNIIEVDSVTDRAWVHITVEGPVIT